MDGGRKEEEGRRMEERKREGRKERKQDTGTPWIEFDTSEADMNNVAH